MRISDWSSDMCSSDLRHAAGDADALAVQRRRPSAAGRASPRDDEDALDGGRHRPGRNLARPQADPHRRGPARRQVPGLRRLGRDPEREVRRSEEHTSELQSLMRISSAVFCLKKNNKITKQHHTDTITYINYN